MTTTQSPVAAVLHAASWVESRFDARLATVGLSLPKLAALRVLVNAGEALPLGQVADRLACVRSNVTQLIDRLESDGLVSRESDPTDRRACLASVTEAGRHACENGMRIYKAAEDEVFGVLSPEEMEHLSRLLARLHPRDPRCG
jgi:DNA-binding MarR family transcriptional regulator